MDVTGQQKPDGSRDVYGLNHVLLKLQEHLFQIFRQQHHSSRACHALMDQLCTMSVKMWVSVRLGKVSLDF